MSNGCGCEKGMFKYIKPPYARRYYVPCVLHDNAYDKGGTEQDRKEADATLFANMRKVAEKHSRSPYNLTWHTVIALLYYTSIRIFGRFYFNYTANNDYT